MTDDLHRIKRKLAKARGDIERARKAMAEGWIIRSADLLDGVIRELGTLDASLDAACADQLARIESRFRAAIEGPPAKPSSTQERVSEDRFAAMRRGAQNWLRSEQRRQTRGRSDGGAR